MTTLHAGPSLNIKLKPKHQWDFHNNKKTMEYSNHDWMAVLFNYAKGSFSNVQL
jgi:hypothetical protein